jgi:hypothetical protein
MKLGTIVGAVVAAGLLSGAGQAAASTWVATYKGFVDGGYDTTGVFGTAERYLDGLAFTATFTYDTEAPLGVVSPAADGEIGLGIVLDSTLEVGGSTFTFGSGFGNHIETYSDGPFGAFGPGYVFHQVTAAFSIPGFFSFNDELTLAGGGATAAFLGQAVAETSLVEPNSGGSTAFLGYFQIDENSIFGVNSAYGYLRPESYSVAEVPSGGVPEPATWALMILGFGAAGAGLRRRKPALA